jgi:hypothetical protein
MIANTRVKKCVENAQPFGMELTMKGSCLCGAVAYEIDSLDTPIGHCHCNTCRKAHGAAYGTNAGVMRNHFRWLQGEQSLSRFESSPGKIRYFCSRCGSHILAERSAQPHVILRVATLDEDPNVRATMHVWRSHDVPWLQDDPAAPHYLEWQPDR